MIATKHAVFRMKRRTQYKDCVDYDNIARMAFRSGEQIPNELVQIYLSRSCDRDGIFKLWKDMIWVFNNEGTRLITVMNILRPYRNRT